MLRPPYGVSSAPNDVPSQQGGGITVRAGERTVTILPLHTNLVRLEVRFVAEFLEGPPTNPRKVTEPVSECDRDIAQALRTFWTVYGRADPVNHPDGDNAIEALYDAPTYDLALEVATELSLELFGSFRVNVID